MRFFHSMGLAVVFLAACSARGSGGIGGPLPTDDTGANDAMVPPGDASPTDSMMVNGDTPAGDDALVGQDVPVGTDVPVTMDTPTGEDRVEPMDVRDPVDMVTVDKPQPMDRPPELFCGDGMCSSSRSETCSSCPADCGPCPPECAGVSCTDCVMAAGCGWCGMGTIGVCVPGNASGPSAAPCPAAWVGPGRGSACTAGTDAGTDSSTTDVPSTDPTRACTASYSGTSRECGWTVSRTFTCTAGARMVVGCNTTTSDAGPLCGSAIGSCTGDPVLRLCSGTGACSFATRVDSTNSGVGTVNPSDDTCGTCPVTNFTCPSSGRITVMVGAYSNTTPGTCTPAIR